MSSQDAQRDHDPEQGVWYYHGHGNASVPRQQAPAVDYFCGDAFVTGWLLYTSGDVAFVQFRTMEWGAAYDGYSNYVVTAIFCEHLRPPEQKSGFLRFLRNGLGRSSDGLKK